MHEYTANRFECCDARLPFKFNYCPTCGSRIPKVEDTEEIAKTRELMMIVKSNKTRIQSLRDEIREFLKMKPHQIEQYNETCYPWTYDNQLASMQKDIDGRQKRINMILGRSQP